MTKRAASGHTMPEALKIAPKETSSNRRHRQNPSGSSTSTTPTRRRWKSNGRKTIDVGSFYDAKN
jgi:hypothetical protein